MRAGARRVSPRVVAPLIHDSLAELGVMACADAGGRKGATRVRAVYVLGERCRECEPDCIAKGG